jgi:hypothetical protein
MVKALTTEEFIIKANLKHSNKYSYSNVVYKNSRTNVIITCLEHGDFEQTPNSHIYDGAGCLKCSGHILTIDKFIERSNLIHKHFYNYSKVIYKNSINKVIIICPEHGEFEQSPPSHLNGKGCIKCAGKALLTKEEFIKKSNLIHLNKYSYCKVILKCNRTKVVIGCPEHGDFIQRADHHLSGSGCSKCIKTKYSKIAIDWIKYIEYITNKEIQYIFSPLGEYIIPKTKFKADGYCKETNTIYEFHGDFWHGNPKKYNPDDINPILKKSYRELYNQTQLKKKKIIELGYNYVEIWESNWIKAIKALIKIQRLWKKYFKNISIGLRSL